MIRGQIIITLADGQAITYANKYLVKKTGTDGSEYENPKFEGYPEYSYYYTGYGDDTYDDQTELGMIKADFEFLTEQIGVVGNDKLRFPEEDEGHGGTTTLVRKAMSTVNADKTYSKIEINTDQIVSIKVKESWENYPYGRESGYQLPKDSPNFFGFQESQERKEKGVDNGPDFNAHLRYDTGFIANPTLSIKDGSLVITNEKEFDETVINETKNGYEVYGISNGKKSGISYINKE